MTQLSRFRTVWTGVVGAPWYSNHYFQGDVPEGAAYGPFVADFWRSMETVISSAVTWEVEPTYVALNSEDGEIYDVGDWAGDTDAGAAATQMLPQANQAIIHWRTGAFVGGRELRGKTFVPGLTEAATSTGLLTSGTSAVILAAAEGLISDANGAFVVLSRKHLTDEIITGAVVSSKFGVLRSRRD